MADTPEAENRTEQPTSRRLQKAREEGSVARAHGLPSAAILVVGALVLMLDGGALVERLEKSLFLGLRLQGPVMRDPADLGAAVARILEPGLEILAPFLVLMAVVGFFADTAIGGWIFSARPLIPDFARINPQRGLRELFSRDSLVEVIKALAKSAVIGLVAYWLIKGEARAFLGLVAESWPLAMRHLAGIAATMFLVLAVSLAGVVALEVPYQLWSHRDQLKMSRQELKEELHELEGSPHTKRRIKGLRRRLARMRMMSQVPKADAVVTNPEHYAAALRYREGQMRAPRLLAKGSGLTALRIREIAVAHAIPVIEAPPLARSICRYVEIEEEIPVGLYQAVAEVMAYVYRLRAARAQGRPAPLQPRDERFNPPREFEA